MRVSGVLRTSNTKLVLHTYSWVRKGLEIFTNSRRHHTRTLVEPVPPGFPHLPR